MPRAGPVGFRMSQVTLFGLFPSNLFFWQGVIFVFCDIWLDHPKSGLEAKAKPPRNLNFRLQHLKQIRGLSLKAQRFEISPLSQVTNAKNKVTKTSKKCFLEQW